jgi:chromate transporter
MNQLADLASTFGYLSLLTVGGGLAAFPALKTLTVDTYHWLTFPELLHLYSLGQLAPGPNMMMVAAVGMWVAGAPGAVVALVCFTSPWDVAPSPMRSLRRLPWGSSWCCCART